MPHEWPFSARWAAWRRQCAKADEPRILAEATGAFVDRTPIDWTALLAQAGASVRPALENLRALDILRRQAGRADHPASTIVAITRLTAALAMTQILASAAIAAFVGIDTASPNAPAAIVLTAAYTAALVPLALTSDPRGIFLLTTFACVASAFARATHASPPWPFAAIFFGLYPEALIPACLWQFAAAFPRVRRFTRFDRLARRIAGVVWLLGALLFAVNLAVAYDAVLAAPLVRLTRNHEGNAFWSLFALAAVPALAVILMRARRAPPAERRKVGRFAASIACGSTPLLSSGLLRLTLPGVDRWFRTPSLAHDWINVLMLSGLALMPLAATAALLADRPFGLPRVSLLAARRRFAHGLITALVATPFAGLLLMTYAVRRIPLGDLASSRAGAILALWAIAGTALAVLKPRLHEALHRRGFRRHVDHRERLSTALDRIRLTRGPREMADILGRELRESAGATSVRLLTVQPGGALRDVDGPRGPVPLQASPLIDILRGGAGPLDLSEAGGVRDLLLPRDREWVETADASLAVPVTRRDDTIGAVLLLGPRQGGGRFNRHDRWLIRTLTAAAAAAWSTDAGPASDSETALECTNCGRVEDSRDLPCGCGAPITLAALPRRIGDKFLVEQRAGAGAMGVVYRGRDLALDRVVALKTLPRLGGGMVARLGDEARAMAALDHPALATIYGVERWRDTPILVVEYLAGGTLSARLAQGRLGARQALEIGVTLAGALDYMHARGVLHRDLKPSNIAFTAAGAPVLLDFGLAIVAETEPPAAGTLDYLPPEAWEGAAAARAFDLWALAVVVIEALAGVHPFPSTGRAHGLDRVPAAAAEVVRSLVHGDLPLAFIERALARDPRRRFRTAKEMRDVLKELLDQRQP